MCVFVTRTEHLETEGETTMMRTLTFGIEIETVGQTRQTVAEAIRTVVGGRVEYAGGAYDAWHTVDATGRVWKVVTDASLSASRDRQAEVVSPILKYEDLEQLQEVVRAIRRAHARADHSCGIHVHVGSATFDARTIANLVKIIHKQEPLIEQALGISQERLTRWCRPIEQHFLQKIEQRRPQTMSELNVAWYGYHNVAPTHYDGTRYHGLNLHNVWFRNTIEFRYFDGSLHAGQVKAYIQFVLALAAKALNARAASSKRRTYDPATARYDFRVFLLGLGLIGDEFKTARHHLLAKLDGSSAWKHGRPAERTA